MHKGGFSIVKEPKRYVWCAGCNHTIKPKVKHLKFYGAAKCYSITKRLCGTCLEALTEELQEQYLKNKPNHKPTKSIEAEMYESISCGDIPSLSKMLHDSPAKLAPAPDTIFFNLARHNLFQFKRRMGNKDDKSRKK